jgi:hypothetical protein
MEESRRRHRELPSASGTRRARRSS